MDEMKQEEKEGKGEAEKQKSGRGGRVNFSNPYVLLITKTAALLAVTVVLQFAGHYMFAAVPKPFDTVLTGSLVNMCLFIAAPLVGLIGGAVVAFITPVMAFATGHMGFAVLMPFIGIANFTIVLLIWAYLKYLPKKLWLFIVFMILATIIKFVAMYGFVLQLAPILGIPGKGVAALQINFSWPQLVAAAIGGVLSIPIMYGLMRARILNVALFEKRR